jgi:Outer membrane protein beta-barrel domain
MKHLLILLMLACPVLLSAQRFNGGIIAGGLVSQVDGDTWDGYHKFGFLGGGLVSLRVSARSSFQMELEYIQKGSRLNADTITNQGLTYLLRLHYLEVPLLYQFTFAKRLSFEAGPAMDVLIGSQELVNGFDDPKPVPLKPITLTGIIGFSGYITNHLKANFRFNYSLMSIRNGVANGYRRIIFDLGQYNNVMSLSLFWYFKPNEDL